MVGPGAPQMFGEMAPHVWPVAQVPQLVTERALPQLSVPEMAPQLAPMLEHKAVSLSGAQTHVLFEQVCDA
jgi:hypothetical protein